MNTSPNQWSDDLPEFIATAPAGAEGTNQSWAVSYGDMITQLLVFFVVIISVSKVSTIKLEAVQKSMRGETQTVNTIEKLEKELNQILIIFCC